MGERARWIEAHQGLTAILLFGVPFGLGWLLKRAGVPDGWADLTQFAIGVPALIAVVVILVRGRANDDPAHDTADDTG